MKADLEYKPNTSNTDAPEIAHAYKTWQPLPWVSLCKTRIKYSESDLVENQDHIKCVVCLDIMERQYNV